MVEQHKACTKAKPNQQPRMPKGMGENRGRAGRRNKNPHPTVCAFAPAAPRLLGVVFSNMFLSINSTLPEGALSRSADGSLTAQTTHRLAVRFPFSSSPSSPGSLPPLGPKASHIIITITRMMLATSLATLGTLGAGSPFSPGPRKKTLR